MSDEDVTIQDCEYLLFDGSQKHMLLQPFVNPSTGKPLEKARRAIRVLYDDATKAKAKPKPDGPPEPKTAAADKQAG